MERASSTSIHARSACAGSAPTCRATSSPSRSKSIVGMPCTPKRCEIPGATSTFTLTTFSLPAKSPAACSISGPTMRHGPHHGAHRSTSTSEVASTKSAKSDSTASTTQGNGRWQEPHWGVPLPRFGTRFRVAHAGHFTIVPVIVSSSALEPKILLVRSVRTSGAGCLRPFHRAKSSRKCAHPALPAAVPKVPDTTVEWNAGDSVCGCRCCRAERMSQPGPTTLSVLMPEPHDRSELRNTDHEPPRRSR